MVLRIFANLSALRYGWANIHIIAFSITPNGRLCASVNIATFRTPTASDWRRGSTSHSCARRINYTAALSNHNMRMVGGGARWQTSEPTHTIKLCTHLGPAENIYSYIYGTRMNRNFCGYRLCVCVSVVGAVFQHISL